MLWLPLRRVVQATRGIGEYAVGETASLERRISADDVARFVELTGDDNPVHVDDAYAATMGLPSRVAHGVLTSGYVSTVIGTQLPGPGALWLSERFQFRAPVFIGDTIKVEVIVRRISKATRVLVLDVEVRNGRGKLVLDGEAHVQVLEERVEMTEVPTTVQSAVVTGSGRGIGAAIAKRLAGAGVQVVLNYRNDEERARETLDQILADSGEATLFQADISDPEQAAALMAHGSETYGQVDALVNNAGGPPEPLALKETSWEEIERHLASHVRGSFNCIQAVLPGMMERGLGRIVSITSQTAYGVPAPKMAGYTLAKAALAALTRSIALEGGPHGVTANSIAPGMTDTQMMGDVSPRAKAVLASQTPLRRLAQVGDIAEAVLYLVGPGGTFVTGQTIHLSGGQEMA
jgi:3-oxoacyl-[acyl-carrier protein] reductase